MKVKVAAARGAEVASCAAEVPLINVNFSPNSRSSAATRAGIVLCGQHREGSR